MRDIPTSIAAAWNEGRFVGDRKANVRVTVQHPHMRLHHYALTATATGTVTCSAKKGKDVITPTDPGGKISQSYANYLFENLKIPRELPYIKSVSWSRSIDSDAAECTIVAYNSKPLDLGETPTTGELDHPGWFTYSRGGASGGAFSSRWKYQRNAWFGLLMPDNIIRTYEGWGADYGLIPELDPNLVQTGLWLIDSVVMTDGALMTIKCRDMGRILMDQLYMDPVVPKKFQNEGFGPWTGLVPISVPVVKVPIAADRSSGSIVGHPVGHAFDGNPNTFWESPGRKYSSNHAAYEWVQGTVKNKTVSRVRLRTRKNGYTFYVSVRVNGRWQGSTIIPYTETGDGYNGADIAYIAQGTIDANETKTVVFDVNYTKVEAIRITLTNLQDFRTGTNKYHAGVREVELFANGTPEVLSEKTAKGPAGANPGHYNDYTDIVKLCCAWAGFFWPRGSRARLSDGTFRVHQPPAAGERVLGIGVPGRVWGDFLQSGAVGPVALDAENFDKRTLMDCISYVRDILGFIFYIDEFGGAVWKLPNIFDFGCYRGATFAVPKYQKGFAHTIDENSVLMTLSVSLDGSNVREAYFVGDTNGQVGAYAPGFNPNPTGLRRVAGWTDQNFAPETDMKGISTKQQVADAQTQAEVMADMISLRQLFTYRQDQVRIPANPAIQIDDQVRINERTTGEGYVHYVTGIESSLDMETGEWTYDLTTTWLGQDPKIKWLFKTSQLAKSTSGLLNAQVLASGTALGPSRRLVV